MNECLVNILHFMNSGSDDLVKENMVTMGNIFREVGSRSSPVTTPRHEEGEEEDGQEDFPSEESEGAKKRRYLHRELEECSDTEMWIGLHHFETDPMEVA